MYRWAGVRLSVCICGIAFVPGLDCVLHLHNCNYLCGQKTGCCPRYEGCFLPIFLVQLWITQIAQSKHRAKSGWVTALEILLSLMTGFAKCCLNWVLRRGKWACKRRKSEVLLFLLTKHFFLWLDAFLQGFFLACSVGFHWASLLYVSIQLISCQDKPRFSYSA